MKCNYISPILTSINADGTVDYETMHKLYDTLINAGIDGILVGGSSGEFYAFTYEEIKEFILDAISYIGNRAIVMAGTGRMAYKETVDLSNLALAAGATSVLVVGPYYSACNQEDVFNYYDNLLTDVNGPLYIYNYEDRTGYDVTVDTFLRLLAKHKHLEGMKDTHAMLRHTQKYIQLVKSKYPDFIVYTGYDNNCIPSVISGGDGCIGALSNVYPSLCAEVVESLRKEDLNQIVKSQRSIDEKMRFYEVYTPFNPVMKWAMAELGLGMQENCKAPLTALTEDTKASLSGFADQLWRNK
ncbi:dihydrodipicolinate synthase family protein [Pelosinus propionicus]|uniref:4-hydroxy-tetrahydrodipicolinate synthase n=1 Tax=Pelosinus propionicus DSM 13327 TaxID=1123291 RepID=A0A1I4J0E2_9FIRM|nr:dihydrodipicolinate synthase family protein [Pelosinus propionicus]SFL59717.1 4-hydroxy-tetrahydrodipicolinate synthase [Pelosinus propionicus DSM 13327]